MVMTMAEFETLEDVVRSRVVSAAAVLHHRVDLSGYPHQLLAVLCREQRGPWTVGYAVAAAEILEQQGWTLINLTDREGIVYAILRRPSAAT
jgi:hypothetical protein